jgi:hypothetical protein
MSPGVLLDSRIIAANALIERPVLDFRVPVE